MDQNFFDWVLAGFSGLLGFLLNVVWNEVKALQAADKDLVDKVSHIEVLVAGTYVKKDDLDKLTQAIFTKLDRIEAKIDTKMDKGGQ